ncbi:MAG: RNA methyltransferase [Crocinitomicaceae bacterium]|nr:RNA methyltransferase [Crocinitomicaceae bacterium]
MQQKKFRDSEGLFVVEGVKMVSELISQDQYKVKSLYFTEDCGLDIPKNIEANSISKSDLERISGFKQPNQILALVEMGSKVQANFNEDGMILCLDEVKDPGNLGTIIRTADWFGMKQIICSLNTVDHFNPKVIQASMGSIFRINIIYEDLFKLAGRLKDEGFACLGADLNGENAFTYDYPVKTALFMGSESHGLSKELGNMITRISIPKFGKAESLNVGMAAGIIIAQYKRSSTL